jgi:hypothetical protein
MSLAETKTQHNFAKLFQAPLLYAKVFFQLIVLSALVKLRPLKGQSLRYRALLHIFRAHCLNSRNYSTKDQWRRKSFTPNPFPVSMVTRGRESIVT